MRFPARLVLLSTAVLLGTASSPVDGQQKTAEGSLPLMEGHVSLALRAPYLQGLATDSVLVVWKTVDASEPYVDFGPTAALGSSVRATAQGERRVAVLRNLQPGERYFYRVRAGSRVLAQGGRYTFRTDAGPSDRSYSFFVTADIGTTKGYQAMTARDIMSTKPRPELGILAGDIVYKKGRSENYDERLMQPWGELLSSIPVWPALGNHDWKSDPRDNFEQEWYLPNNEHYYSFDYANAHFIALDTRDGEIFDRKAQVRWLKADLEASQDADWIFVYYHHPGVTCTYKGDNDEVIEHLLPLFDRYGVDIVFNGHAHTYERLYPLYGGQPVDREQDPHYVDPGGTLYIVSGAGGKFKKNEPTRRCGPTAFFLDETILWTEVRVEGSTCTVRTYRSRDHRLIDEVSLTKTRLASLQAQE